MAVFELDWEMGLFRGLRALWRSMRPEPELDHDPELAAVVAGAEDRWRWFASVVAGRPLKVSLGREHGGIRGDTLLLPHHLHVVDDLELNRALLLVRVAIDATVARASPDVPADDGERFAASLRAVSGAVSDLELEFGAFAAAWREAAHLASRVRPSGRLGPRGAVEEAARRRVLRGERIPEDLGEQWRHADATGAPSPPVPLWGHLIPVHDRAGEVADPGKALPSQHASEALADAIEELEVIALSEEGITEMPIHSFEKVEMAEPFNGSFRQLDGEDDLDDHLESLDEVDLGTLLRGGPQAHSLLRADISMDAHVPDVDHIAHHEIGIAYDEWDGRSWLKDWCTVYPAVVPPGGDDQWATQALGRHRRTVEELYDRLLAHRSERRRRRGELDGDIDLAAVVAARADLAAGRTPSARLFEQRRRQGRDVATTVLLDVSLSSDSWVDGQRVLDVSREALLVLGEVADRLGDRLQILAFASSTRNKVRVWTLHDWHEPWSAGRRALGRIEPQGYTRLGAAIRHATRELSEVAARNRVLLLITDGKPTDWDRYEGRHGVSDVRMALREARSAGVAPHALAVDAGAKDYLPQMLGPGAWDVLAHPRDLPDALGRAWGRFTH